MKRLHVHVATTDLERSVAYYTALLGAPPVKRAPDYARWLTDDPYAHVSVSTRTGREGVVGVDHVGVMVETAEDLEAVADRLAKAGAPAQPEKSTTCCYATSDKYWSRDPQGAVWEIFHTNGEATTYAGEPEAPR
ncbi:MAG: VOC family protein [Parvularculaceae bacterium]